MFNNKIFIIFFVAICYSKVFGQFPNPLNFNTATNSSNTGTLPIGNNDLHWTAALTNSLGTYVPAVVVGNVGGWSTSPFPNVNWITYPHTCSANPAEHACLGNVDEYYKTTLTLPANSCGMAIVTPSAYCLSLDFMADNWVSEIYVNNVLSFTNPNANPYAGGWGFLSSFMFTATMCNNWQVGTNTIIVHVKSGAPSFPGWTGFLAQANQTVNTTVGIPLNASITQTNVSCFGNNNGAAYVNVTGGGGAYTYTWLPIGGNGSIANNLPFGNYSLSVAAIGGCVTSQTFTITQPSVSLLSVSGNTSVCNGNTVNLSANGVNNYLWSNGSTGSLIAVNAPGIFTVTGTNTLTGCSLTNTISVALAPSPFITINGNTPLCLGSVASLTANGANTYTWNTGNNGSILINTPNSTTIYTVAANTIGNNCISSQTFTVNILPSTNLILTGNSSICQGNTGTIYASGANTYTWSNGTVSNSLSINTNTTFYSVVGTNTITGCNNTGSINITIGSYPIISINNTSVCLGQSVELIASGATSYTWSNGSQENAINVNPYSNQIFTVTASGTLPFCINTQTVKVTVIPSPTLNLTSDKNKVCSGQHVNLSASGTDNYYWNSGALTNIISVTPTVTSTYTVIGGNNNLLCKTTKTIEIVVDKLPDVKILADTNACIGDQIILKVFGASDYLWNNSLNTQTISAVLKENDFYSVIGVNINTGCYSTATISPLASDLCCEVYIPNTFTPNDDKKNDFFSPLSFCKFKDYKLTVYNRWGERIFIANAIHEQWNGFYKNVLCKEDVYVYTLDYTIIKNSGTGSKHFYKTGHINLIGENQ